LGSDGRQKKGGKWKYEQEQKKKKKKKKLEDPA